MAQDSRGDTYTPGASQDSRGDKITPGASKDSAGDRMGRHAMLKRFIKRHHKKHKPNAKAPLGQGGRFAALESKLSGRPGVTDPKALAAAIGRKKYGNAKFQSLGRK